MTHVLSPDAQRAETWHARLALRYRADGERTTVAREFRGPLQVQKALYPEGPRVCHSIVVHPPGGIAGGDELDIDVAVERGAQALITTPGATRWYKANGRTARQHVGLRVAGALEWLPQEAIVFDAARVSSSIDIDVAAGAATIGWDIVALGRAAAGETFSEGVFAQSIRLREDGVLRWHERTRLTGNDPLLHSPVGLDDRHVFACLWAVGAEPAWSDETVDELRAALADGPVLTCLTPRLLVARTVATSTRVARTRMEAAWSALRPRVLGLAAQPPRLWAM